MPLLYLAYAYNLKSQSGILRYMKSLKRLIELQEFLHAFQSIERVVDVPGREAPENDVEHSYNLAMAAWFLAESFPELDRDKVIRYALIHDIVEVHAGDTYALADAEELAAKPAREAAALKKIKVDWKDFGDMANAMHDYELKIDQEANFVYALDKLMPIIVMMISKGTTWKDRGVKFEDVRKSKESKVAKSPRIVPYFEELVTLLEDNQDIFAK